MSVSDRTVGATEVPVEPSHRARTFARGKQKNADIKASQAIISIRGTVTSPMFVAVATAALVILILVGVRPRFVMHTPTGYDAAYAHAKINWAAVVGFGLVAGALVYLYPECERLVQRASGGVPPLSVDQ